MFSEEKPHLLPLPLKPFRYYQYGERVVICTVAWRWRPPITAYRQDRADEVSKCNGMRCMCASCIPAPTNFFTSTCARNAADIASRKKTTPRKCRWHSATVAARRTCRIPNRQALPVDLSAASRDGHPPHPRSAFPDQEIRGGRGRRRLRHRSGIGVAEHRFVRRYLERRPHPQMFLRQIDTLIRKLTEYRDFINLKIKEQPE